MFNQNIMMDYQKTPECGKLYMTELTWTLLNSQCHEEETTSNRIARNYSILKETRDVTTQT